jgi:hypothetical protein
VAAPELNSVRRRGWVHRPRGSTGAHLSKEVRSGAAGHVVALKPTSAGRCGPKLQLTWQRVDARPTPCLDLELVPRGTRSSGCRHLLRERRVQRCRLNQGRSLGEAVRALELGRIWAGGDSWQRLGEESLCGEESRNLSVSREQ